MNKINFFPQIGSNEIKNKDSISFDEFLSSITPRNESVFVHINAAQVMPNLDQKIKSEAEPAS